MMISLRSLRVFSAVLLLLVLAQAAFASDKDFPPMPSPPRLVNDLAHTMSADEISKLEQKLLDFEKTTSTQISVVTIRNLGGYEVDQYAVELASRWGVGTKSKSNGVLVLAAIDDHKINISTGYGLEGALTDAMCGRIIRNEMVPEFKAGNYYEGFSKASDAIIAATKGEYTADPQTASKGGKRSIGGIIIMIIILIIFLSKIGGGGGGNYMSGRGRRSGLGSAILGGLLGNALGRGFGGGGGGNWGSGGGFGGGSGGGGFGGFGGGGFGGGGASGSW
jgi:uncharacterized protein